MKGRQKALFSFVFFLAFSHLSLSLKCELTTSPFSLLTIIFNNKEIFPMVIIDSSFSLSARLEQSNTAKNLAFSKFLFLFHLFFFFTLFLIVLHNVVKRHSDEKSVICDMDHNGEFGSSFCSMSFIQVDQEFIVETEKITIDR